MSEARKKSIHWSSTSIHLVEYNGDMIRSMDVELETIGTGVRPNGWISLQVSGDTRSPTHKSKRNQPLTIWIDDSEAIALAQTITAYVEQRKLLPR